VTRDSTCALVSTLSHTASTSPCNPAGKNDSGMRAYPGVRRNTEKPNADCVTRIGGETTTTRTRGRHVQQANLNSNATPTQPQHHLGETESNYQRAEHRAVTAGHLQRLQNTANEGSHQYNAGDRQSLHRGGAGPNLIVILAAAFHELGHNAIKPRVHHGPSTIHDLAVDMRLSRLYTNDGTLRLSRKMCAPLCDSGFPTPATMMTMTIIIMIVTTGGRERWRKKRRKKRTRGSKASPL
jgi:hypothetical protein